MIDQTNLKKFDKIYNSTYQQVQKLVVCKCSSIDDVNDIIQDVYVDVYKNIEKLDTKDNVEAYILGIARNKVKKYYSWLYKFKKLSHFSETNDKELIDNTPDDVNIESIILKNADIDTIWKFLRRKKVIINKIFYLYYNEGYTIKEISEYLNIGESYVKNCLYRTLKELQSICDKDGDNHD